MAQPESRYDYLKFLDLATKLGTLSVVAAYLVGFFVVSSHLAKFGVSTLDVIHLKYLIVGAWVLAPTILPIVVVKVSLVFARNAATFWDISPSRFVMIFAASSVVPIGLIIAFLSLYFAAESRHLSLRASLILWLNVLAGSTALELLWSSLTVDKDKQDWLFNRNAVPYHAATLVGVIMLFAFCYGRFVYPLQPYELGGGRPLAVSFIEGNKPFPESLVRDGQSHRTVPYQLLGTSDKSYYVICPKPNENSIEVNRDSVGGMVAFKEK